MVVLVVLMVVVLVLQQPGMSNRCISCLLVYQMMYSLSTEKMEHVFLVHIFCVFHQAKHAKTVWNPKNQVF